jgi:hypothetical protein
MSRRADSVRDPRGINSVPANFDLRGTMKAAILTFSMLLVTASASCQKPAIALPAACGPADTLFSTEVTKAAQNPMQPEPGKALVYFIQDDGPSPGHQRYTVRIGLDGQWVGAYGRSSYFVLSIAPGEHHLCANVQPGYSTVGHGSVLARFSAEPGKVYYLRTRFLVELLFPALQIDQPDSDEAGYLLTSYPMSTSRLKK